MPDRAQAQNGPGGGALTHDILEAEPEPKPYHKRRRVEAFLRGCGSVGVVEEAAADDGDDNGEGDEGEEAA